MIELATEASLGMCDLILTLYANFIREVSLESQRKMRNIAQIEQNDMVSLLDGRLCAGARSVLGWSQDDLSLICEVARRTISDFERGNRKPHRRLVCDLVGAFVNAGIVFVASEDGSVGLMVKARSQA